MKQQYPHFVLVPELAEIYCRVELAAWRRVYGEWYRLKRHGDIGERIALWPEKAAAFEQLRAAYRAAESMSVAA